MILKKIKFSAIFLAYIFAPSLGIASSSNTYYPGSGIPNYPQYNPYNSDGSGVPDYSQYNQYNSQRYVSLKGNGSRYERVSSGIYIGVDALGIYARHNQVCKIDCEQNDTSQDPLVKDEQPGVGGAIGFRAINDGLFFGPEVFFDYFNSKVKAFDYRENSFNEVSDNTTLNYRYGGRFNLGYRFSGGFSIFVNYGAAAVDYDVRFYDKKISYLSHGGTKVDQIYGAGFMYEFNKNFAIKIAYDRQDFKIRYARDLENGISYQDKIGLDVARIGFVVLF